MLRESQFQRMRCLLALTLLLAGLSSVARASPRADWLRDAGWGVMIHFLPEWLEPERTWTADEWNRTVDAFDVEALARQLRDAGAGYCIFTLGQNSGFYVAPNLTYDRLVGREPSRSSRRDLIADLSAALKPHEIRLVVYLTAGPPGNDTEAKRALGWRGDDEPNHAFQLNWEQVIREWSLRWDTTIAGWWFDGCGRPNLMYRAEEPPNFRSFAAAARAGNPASIIAFNGGMFYPVLSFTPHEDYTAGIIYDFERQFVNPGRVKNGRLDGARVHVLSFLGETWGRGAPRFTREQVAAYTTKVRDHGGAITWDVPVQANGTIAETYLALLPAESGRK